jgi:tagaturonate reductase
MRPLTRQNSNSRSDRAVKVIQFGEGNFLRAFVDWMLDILNEKTDFDGDVQIVQPIENGMGEMLNKQEGLYHVLIQGIEGNKQVDTIRLIKNIKSVINPYTDYSEYLKLAENKDLKLIISNTTEAGIAFSELDKDFESIPTTYPGKLTALLYHRFSQKQEIKNQPLVIIPCELIEKNGDKLKMCILQYADLWVLPAEFKKWIDSKITFCNSLVDRIVPGYPKETIAEIKAQIGFDDNMVVKAEPYHLWAIEGPKELYHLLPFDKAGLKVKIVDDIHPFRIRKVRILNGVHTAMMAYAYLRGFRAVRETVEDSQMAEFIKDLIFEEIIPTIDLPKEELVEFANDVMDRFRNPFIHHEWKSIALNSVSKFKVRVLPTMLDYKAANGNWPEKLAMAMAALFQFYKGTQNGETLPVSDDEAVIAFFQNAWLAENPTEVAKTILANTELWGQDLSNDEELLGLIAGYLTKEIA